MSPRRSLRFLAVLVLAGCESPIPRVDPRSPVFNHLSPDQLESLQLGRETYIGKCSGCHSLYRPDRGLAVEWTRWVDSMALRSKITGEEKDRILGYLQVTSRPEGREAN